MAAEGEVLAAGERFPDEQAAVAVAGGQQHAVGAELQRRHPVGVLLDLVEQRAVLGRVDADHLARAAQGDLRLIGADVGGQDGSRSRRRPSMMRSPVVTFQTDDLARLAAAAAAGQEQAAVAAELQHVRHAFRERQHAEQLQRVGVVEQHLLLPADGDQRRPRVAGQGGHGVGPGGRTTGSSRSVFGGIGGGPAGLPATTDVSPISTFGFVHAPPCCPCFPGPRR